MRKSSSGRGRRLCRWQLTSTCLAFLCLPRTAYVRVRRSDAGIPFKLKSSSLTHTRMFVPRFRGTFQIWSRIHVWPCWPLTTSISVEGRSATRQHFASGCCKTCVTPKANGTCRSLASLPLVTFQCVSLASL